MDHCPYRVDVLDVGVLLPLDFEVGDTHIGFDSDEDPEVLHEAQHRCNAVLRAVLIPIQENLLLPVLSAEGFQLLRADLELGQLGGLIQEPDQVLYFPFLAEEDGEVDAPPEEQDGWVGVHIVLVGGVGVGDGIHLAKVDIGARVHFGELVELGGELLAELAST